MTDTARLKQKLEEVYSIQPNDLHFRPVTRIYKLLTRPLKQMPFLFIIPSALATALVMYLMFGHLVVGLVSLLQYGF
jgi:hypothetical protein